MNCAASFIGRARFFLEVTNAMPRTFGRNQVHMSQVVGWCCVHRLRPPTKTVGTFALGTNRLHEFLHENTAIELHALRYVNDPRIIANETNFVSINATLSVDFLGQCASKTIGGSSSSSSGGQNDFARGAMYSEGGQGFVVVHSTTSQGVSRIVAQHAPGEVVTTPENTVDKIVTEFGIAELRGRSIREWTHALIAVACPNHREALTAAAKRLACI